MAWRLNDIVVCGEIYNLRKNSVHGVLGLRGCERPVSLQLTGNCDPDLAGRSFRFEVRESPMLETRVTSEVEMDEQHFAWMQVGPPGSMTAARQVRAFDCSVEEFLRRSKLGEQPPTEWKRCLYLEWYGQNGRMVIELVDPIIEFLEPGKSESSDFPSDVLTDSDLQVEDPFSDESLDSDAADLPSTGLGITAIEFDEDGNSHIYDLSPSEDGEGEDDLDGDDPYGLFPANLESEIGASSSASDWHPEVDEETLRLWAEWDEIFDGTKDVPICTLFDPPLKLAPADQLDDEQVAVALNVLLGRLAFHGIALDMCEHFTARTAYCWLLEEVLNREFAHPNLPATGYVQHYCTFESCEECAAEFDAKLGDDPPDDTKHDSDFPF